MTLRDGRELRHREAINRGCADRPLSNQDIVAKYRENATTAVSPQRAERILQAVLELDRHAARDLSRALAAPA